MAQNDTIYSQTQGLKLLGSAVREFGPLFTLEQIRPLAGEQELTDTHLHNVISELAGAGWIELIKRGVYLTRNPLYSGEVPAFALAAALVQPAAISHWSACAHHGFTTQNPAVIQASTPRKVITPEMRMGKANSPRGRAVWTALGIDFEFIHVASQRFWGFDRNWVNAWQQVNITDPERTALDLAARPDIFGGFSAVMEILESAVRQIQVDRLVEYALRYDTGSVIKRLGWALENLGIVSERLEPLRMVPVKRIYLLDPTREKGMKNDSRWQVNINL